MKRFWVVLLSLGLVMAFSASAFAVSANFTGQWYARQSYMGNPSLLEKEKGNNRGDWANSDQRLRVYMRMKIVEGVDLVMRSDFLESTWGREQSMMPPAALPANPSAKNQRDYNIGNVSVEQLFLTFKTGIGEFRVGNQSGTPVGWGTWFLNAPGTAAGIKWTNTFGNVSVVADAFKTSKGDVSSAAASGELYRPNLLQMDRDRDYYDLGATYKTKSMEAGLLMSYFRFATTRTPAGGSMDTALFLDPYFKAKVGPFDLEGEAYYTPMGKKEFDAPAGANKDQSYKAKGIYLSAKYNMGPAWVRAHFTYASGADPANTAANGGDITTGHKTFGYGNDNDTTQWSSHNPTILIGVASDSYHTYLPVAGRAADLAQSYENMYIYNLSAGYSPSKKLSFDGKISVAKLDKVNPAVAKDDKLGTELDLRATYKIYDALSYNIGAAYLWTGDYFKGNTTEELKNAYFLTHWLDLRF